MADLVVRGLGKRFGAVQAVAGVDLAVRDGEFVFLLGPSGCGKTTTLRMIAGLEMPSAGRIEIGGRDVTYLRPRHRNVGMVFQDYGLYSHMTAFGNIAYPLHVRGLRRAEVAARVRAVAETMQIVPVLDRMPDQLAAGQLQRVAIARMLVREADVFLMDEPMSHLDAQLRGHMRAELRHLQKKLGVTTVFVTHDQLEAMTMADRIIVMDAGRMLQFATPIEIFERPANEFVATFIGEPQMNVFDVTLAAEGGRPVAEAGGFRVPLDPGWLARAGLGSGVGARLRLGIRPEHIALAPEPGGEGESAAELWSFEPTGAENLCTMRLGSELITVRSPVATLPAAALTTGRRLWLRCNPGWLYLFDPADGRTLAQAADGLPGMGAAA